MHERERDRSAALLVERDHLREVDVGERVARDHDERAVEITRELAHRTAGPERRLLDAVAEAHADGPAVPVAVLDDRCEVLERHERVLDTVPLQQVEDVSETRLIDDGHHRLRPVDRERTQPASLAAGHDDGLHEGESSSRVRL